MDDRDVINSSVGTEAKAYASRGGGGRHHELLNSKPTSIVDVRMGPES